MALTFGATATDRVYFTGRDLITNVFTIAGWVKPSSLTNNDCFFGTPGANPANHSQDAIINFIMRTIGSAGAIGLIVNGVGTNVASLGSLMTTGAWQYIAAVLDAPNGVAKLYRGTTSVAVAEVPSYSVQTPGSTTTVWSQDDPSNDKYTWGARFAGGAYTNSFHGDMSWGQIWNRVLTLAELQAQQFTPVPTDTNQQAYHQFGYTAPTNGNQPDWSGHSPARDGTISGATVATHVTGVTINAPAIPTIVPGMGRSTRLGISIGV